MSVALPPPPDAHTSATDIHTFAAAPAPWPPSEAASSRRASPRMPAAGSAMAATGGDCTQQLFDAARAGSAEKVSAALAVGASLEVQDPWGLTALHSAAIAGHAEVLGLLLYRKAKLEATTSIGKTALHLAASTGSVPTVSLLLERSANVLAETSYGTQAMDMAREHTPGGPCEKLILAELHRRLKEADTIEHDLLTKLADIRTVGLQLRQQLGVDKLEPGEAVVDVSQMDIDPEVAAEFAKAEQMDLEDQPASIAASEDTAGQTKSQLAQPGYDSATTEYWTFASKLLEEWREPMQECLDRSFVRELHAQQDIFSWSGDLVSRSPEVLPILDPEDPVMNDSFYRLGLAVESGQKLQTRIGAELTEEEVNQQMKEQTGRSVFEWEELVIQLRGQKGSWDWSKVSVAIPDPKEGEDEGLQLPEGVAPAPATYAVLTETDQPDPYDEEAEEPPVFRKHDVVGPLGGVLQQRCRYETIYYTGHTKVLHDSQAYEFKLHALTPELKLEPLVIDLVAGQGTNRLRHLSDARLDPLNLKPLLEASSSKGVFATPELTLPPRKYGDAMPRIRSRPSSPNHGDGGAAAAAEQQERIDEAEDIVKAEQLAQEVEEAEQLDKIQEMANVQIVEVIAQGWPYAFVVATQDIYDGERLAVDRGVEYWAKMRSAMARLKQIGRIGNDMVVGVDAEEEPSSPQAPPPPQEPLKFKAREPMKRAQIVSHKGDM